MEVDHLILFSKQQGQEADALAGFGLTEGSNRIHPGQGTRNRKFHFENFFLEIVWVDNEEELRSDRVAPTGLWERCHYRSQGYSPFGLCLAHTEDLDALFADSTRYQPVYFPEGKFFEVLPQQAHPYLPWTCRLPRADRSEKVKEPTEHPRGVSKLSKIIYGIPNASYPNTFTYFLEHNSMIEFEKTEQHQLTLEFDHRRQRQAQSFEDIPLLITY